MGYEPAKRKTGELIYPGLVPGGETGWAMLTGANPEPGAIDVGMFRYVAHQNPAWDWRTFDLEADTALIDKRAVSSTRSIRICQPSRLGAESF